MGLIDKLLSAASSKPRLNNYVVIDFETTGLNIPRLEIIEIAAVKVINSTITAQFDQLVKPCNSISEEITDITGITNQMVSNAPSINRVLPKFLDFIGNNILVGHNIKRFDSLVLATACARFKLPLNNQIVDTLIMSQQAMPKLDNHKLSTMCKTLGVRNDNAHRALSDCIATQAVFEKLMRKTNYTASSIPVVTDIQKFSESTSDKTLRLKDFDVMLLNMVQHGSVTTADVSLLSSWINRNSDLADEYPVYRIVSAINMSAGNDYHNLYSMIKNSCMPDIETFGVNSLIVLNGKNVTVTGEFRYGSRDEIRPEFERRGATLKKSVTAKTDYLIIGGYGSPDWNFTFYGNEYKRAVELIDKGKNISILSENNFWRNLR